MTKACESNVNKFETATIAAALRRTINIYNTIKIYALPFNITQVTSGWDIRSLGGDRKFPSAFPALVALMMVKVAKDVLSFPVVLKNPMA